MAAPSLAEAAASQAAGAQTGTAATANPAYYPPAPTGMRGSHAGSFEVDAPRPRRARMDMTAATDTGEHYDLVVVGGGHQRPRRRALLPCSASAARACAGARQPRRLRRPRQAQRVHARRPHAAAERRHAEHRVAAAVQRHRDGAARGESASTSIGSSARPRTIAAPISAMDLQQRRVLPDRRRSGEDRLVVGSPRRCGHGRTAGAEFLAKTPLSDEVAAGHRSPPEQGSARLHAGPVGPRRRSSSSCR